MCNIETDSFRFQACKPTLALTVKGDAVIRQHVSQLLGY